MALLIVGILSLDESTAINPIATTTVSILLGAMWTMMTEVVLLRWTVRGRS